MPLEKLSIIGLGSLISEQSARRTCPNLSNFRLGFTHGHKRIFNKADSYLIRMDKLPDDKKYACLSAVPDKSILKMYVSIFDIAIEDWPALVEREFEYRLVEIPYEELDGGGTGHAIACLGDYTDDKTCLDIIHADPVRKLRWKEFCKNYDGPIWRYDLEPSEYYLNACLKTFQDLGAEFYNNFLDTTFVGDGRTIRNYLKDEESRNPARGISSAGFP